MVDVKATNAMFKVKCINRSAWARSKGLNPATLSARMNGKLEITDPVKKLLKKDGLLVEI